MEEQTVNEAQLHNFIIRLINDYQEGEITEYKQGAVSALLQVSEQLQQMTVESEGNREDEIPNMIHVEVEQLSERE
ncbi:hypothetical protein [Enterococcus gallinarum]|uniref:hypothetical protein n=1 Tax=Enterococcus gallinarum TaxID=1353 RepID=UPI001F596928|nr:hypothetical protein [Enterococcus gallinarum]